MRGANAQGGEEARADHQRQRDHQAGDQRTQRERRPLGSWKMRSAMSRPDDRC
jgi:hypothetical protein